MTPRHSTIYDWTNTTLLCPTQLPRVLKPQSRGWLRQPCPVSSSNGPLLDELRRIVGFGSMCWTYVDPATWLPSWCISDNPMVGQHQRSLHQSLPAARDLTALAERGFTATSASTDGDLGRNRYWSEIAGPAGWGRACLSHSPLTGPARG